MSCTYNSNDRTLMCENIDLTTIPQILNEKPTDIIEGFVSYKICEYCDVKYHSKVNGVGSSALLQIVSYSRL